ncbi:MAG TPA: hypothetical protein IAC18_06685 [Candidatus Scatomorpha merdipullorum]|uniref:Uncharacterized protein n=1 Tax=Candidatus Scatomorpha merdipullorum TaxID=2840927 RepID=A0A9D1FE44_9FIRM|nr:hypothetical protein [Candidatus Scatomorpha merdipullorum]
MRTAIVIVLMLLAVLLQMYLSRLPKRWPGLVLPIIAFLLSLLYPLNMAGPGGDRGALMAQLLLVWLIANVPTLILLAIYLGSRRRMGRSRERMKMDAQDLE